MNDDTAHIFTRCIHGGQENCEVTGAVMPPIYTSSTYAQESPGVHKGYEYSRSHNLTRYSFERAVASLENTGITEVQDASHGGFAFSSGLAATATCLEMLSTGDCLLAMDDMYGGTYRLMSLVRERSQGLKPVYVDMSDFSAVEAAFKEHQPKMVWVESPTNPTLKVSDLARIAKIADDHGAIAVTDNTFCSPILQRPLDLGMHVVMHSATKYLGGHSDVVGGVLATRVPEIAERLRFLQNSIGSVMGPFDAYLCLRGVKTLGLRMERHSNSAMKIARMLESHDKVERVVYPGLESHPQHEVASRQMSLPSGPGYGGMITMFLKGDIETARRFLETVELFALAESLGGVESLIEHPAIMTHASVPEESRAALGISDTLVRFSVGIEDPDDLMADIRRALDAC
ncbi:MAG: cystathionine beta-lyase [Planctomycetes bacterium TMED75]|nr:cystathionine beta-lyase [Planctomycetaceae bacterium]OUU92487.1 MAG: cystathionine beta-lyase [Planctomycetes bacterium TMED75]